MKPQGKEEGKHLGERFAVIALAAMMMMVGCGVFSLAHAQLAGVTLPSIPASVSATVVQPSQISVTWNASTESSGTIADYYVYRNGQQIATTPDTLFVDSNITSGLYQYTVAAVDANGNVSGQSSAASVTFTVDKTPPSTPTGIVTSGATSTNSAYTQIPVTITWDASTDNVGVAGYRLYRNGTLLTSSTAPYTSTSYADTVIPGTYWYTVVAYDAAGNVSNQSAQATFVANVDNAAPSIPTNVNAQQVGAGDVNVSWSPSTDSVGIAGYQIYRNGVQIASTTGSPYSDTGLTIYTPYSYFITAYDTAGNVSAETIPVTITIQSTNGPSMPDIVSASAGTSTVEVMWATDADTLPITGYTLYRNGVEIASVTSTRYLDQGLASGTYAYTLTATDVSGAVSTSSLPVNATVPTIGYVPPTILNTSPVLINSNTSPSLTVNSAPTFTQSLYFGLRNAQVQSLQSLLVADGYLPAVDATGFFGNLTLHALQQFQCSENIVCTGGAGWGLVGPKTRAVLNGFTEGNTANPSVSASSNASSSSAEAELQALEAELANLEKQL